MYDPDQLISIKWNNTNREWYESHGYIYTKRYDTFFVRASDLPIGSAAKITVTCDYCGAVFEAQNDIVQQGLKIFPKCACQRCAPLKGGEANKLRKATVLLQDAQAYCNQHGYQLLTTVSDYPFHDKMRIVCPIHGEITMYLSNMRKGCECRQCSYRHKRYNRIDTNVIQQTIMADNNFWLNPAEYVNCGTHNLKIRCRCGEIFETSYTNYSRHNVRQCARCGMLESYGERRIRQHLTERQITFEQEKRFKDCRDKKPLPFDFYLPEHNTIIEFDGKHHFEDTVFQNHAITAKHDAIKNAYCEQHGIRLLRIPYHSVDNIEDIIDNTLCA